MLSCRLCCTADSIYFEDNGKLFFKEVYGIPLVQSTPEKWLAVILGLIYLLHSESLSAVYQSRESNLTIRRISVIYFTSDLHFGHRGIIDMKKRPFRNVDEMNHCLLANFNAVVHRNDTVYILGDLCHHMTVDAANAIISRMNGRKYLLKGNHDKNYNPDLFCEIRDLMTLSYNGQEFTLMHYPMLSWPKIHQGGIHLHGHIHESAEYNLKNRAEGIRRYDVGVDANFFCPVSVKSISEFFGG